MKFLYWAYGLLLSLLGLQMALLGYRDSRQYGSEVFFPPNPAGWFMVLFGVGLIFWREFKARKKPK
jgi:hypothetical protein